MEASMQIKKFKEFFEENYLAKLLDNAQKGQNFLIVDFRKLVDFDHKLADILIDQPEEVIKAAEIAAQDFDLGEEVKTFRIRFSNLPESRSILIRNIRSENLGFLYWFKGVVRQKSDVRPQVTAAKFECPSCGNILNVLQLDTKFKEPFRCGCGRKGKFRLLSKELVDAQGLVLEEASEDLEGGEQPKRINVFLKDDMVSPMTDKRTNPGSKILITGIIKEVPIILKTGVQSTRFDLLVEANYVEPVEEDFTELLVDKKDEVLIKQLAADPQVYRMLVNSIAPSIYGHDKVKEAILFQLFGGVQKVRDDGSVTRGDMHILLIGDPGSGKSQLLKRVTKMAPKARYVSGKGASGAGLTATVVKDEFLRGWSLEAGALVLANNGVCCIDEMDKMTPEDRAAMHEALEQQTVTISKANVQATLLARTTVLAAANPKLGRFDSYETIAKQIDLPPTLINRFDLIFPIKDLPDKTRDEELAKFILSLHQSAKAKKQDIDTKILRKYLAYARQRIKPKLTESAMDEIKQYYLKMRSSGSVEGEVKAIPISPRQLEALIRLSEASAKIRLSSKVIKKDARRAIDLLHYCLTQIGVDPETGRIDIDRITTGITATERGRIVGVREIIADLEQKLGKSIPIREITAAAAEKGIEADVVEESIEKLKRSGDIFEPRRGIISRL